MKKFYISLIVLAIIVGVMLFTKPGGEKHVEKVSTELAQYVHESLNKEDEAGLLESIIGNTIVGAISDNLVQLYVKNQLKVEDYAVLNVGPLKYNGEEHVVSIGAFNHVFSLVKTYKMRGDIKK